MLTGLDCLRTRYRDAPKVLGDVVEAILGAIFIDDGWRFETVYSILDTRMGAQLAKLPIDTPKHPVAQLWMLSQAMPCNDMITRCVHTLSGYLFDYNFRLVSKQDS